MATEPKPHFVRFDFDKTIQESGECDIIVTSLSTGEKLLYETFSGERNYTFNYEWCGEDTPILITVVGDSLPNGIVQAEYSLQDKDSRKQLKAELVPVDA